MECGGLPLLSSSLASDNKTSYARLPSPRAISANAFKRGPRQGALLVIHSAGRTILGSRCAGATGWAPARPGVQIAAAPQLLLPV